MGIQQFVRVISILICVLPPQTPSLRLPLELGWPSKERRDPQTPDFVKDQGYPMETHHAVTTDGFILEMHRIPHGLKKLNSPESVIKVEPRMPVLVLHGSGQSSADWVANSPIEDSLGFRLADSGYDVWLGNLRGNEYSRRHVSLTTTDNGFWNHSVEELGIYDVPAMIDYVLVHTDQPQLYFIGFSLSPAAFLVTLAKLPEYNQKIAGSVLLAPGAIVPGFFYGLARLFAPFVVPLLKFVTFIFGHLPTMSHFVTIIFHKVLPVLTNPFLDPLGINLKIFQVFTATINGLITKERLPSVLGVFPSPIAVKVFVHVFQLAFSGRFHEFDYGMVKNLQVYGTVRPPDYNLTNVQCPISIFAGLGDRTIPPSDVKALAEKLPNLVDFHFVDNPRFTHLDFAYGNGVGKLVYTRIINVLDAFGSKAINVGSNEI